MLLELLSETLRCDLFLRAVAALGALPPAIIADDPAQPGGERAIGDRDALRAFARHDDTEAVARDMVAWIARELG